MKILRALERGEGQPGDIETLEQLCRFLGPGKTFCAHAPVQWSRYRAPSNISAKNLRRESNSRSAIPI